SNQTMGTCMKMKLGFAAVLAMSVATSSAFAADDFDKRYTDYQQTSGVSGTLKSIGSDTLNNLMTLWAEDFRKIYPSVKIEIEGKGSSTAPPALIAGTAQFGPMSRAMRPAEIDAFESKYGYKPTLLRVAVDALAVYVNKDNPLKCLALGQVDGIFSVTRNSGSPNITKWDQVGLTGEYAGKYPIARFLYIYMNKNPSTALEPVRAEFIRFMYSKQGQLATVKDGYYPMPYVFAQEDLGRLGLK
ncbi:MAG: PstS family phosphate ABC transporter substrate-binding protein, partial [Alphaproteobacteria bacterium]